MIEIESPLQHWREYEIPGTDEFILTKNVKDGEVIAGVPVAKLGPNFIKGLLPLFEKKVPPIKSVLYQIEKESIAVSSLYYELGPIGSANIQVAHFFNFLKIVGKSGRYLAYYDKDHLLYADWQDIKRVWFIEYFSSLTTIYSGPMLLSRNEK